MPSLNQLASVPVAHARAHATSLRIAVHELHGVELLDFGVHTEGGLSAGLLLARLCMADLAAVSLAPRDPALPDVPQVFVRTDDPVQACLASQYAGWKVASDDYFALGSGPMRALARQEPLFAELPETEDSGIAVGVLESGSLPTASAVQAIRDKLPVNCSLTLSVAPTASQAGTIQVVARSIETALHKLHTLHFPLDAIRSATGIAPLPPVAKNDLHGIGRTNDAILYGGSVNLWVRTDDERIAEIGPRVPSSASAAHGETFLSLFKAANHDFYALDPALFSPAIVTFHNLQTGRSFQFGECRPDLLAASFGLN